MVTRHAFLVHLPLACPQWQRARRVKCSRSEDAAAGQQLERYV
jgi:hypothetical protein